MNLWIVFLGGFLGHNFILVVFYLLFFLLSWLSFHDHEMKDNSRHACILVKFSLHTGAVREKIKYWFIYHMFSES